MVCLRVLFISFFISFASGLELNMKGLPDNSCHSDAYGKNKICEYTLDGRLRIIGPTLPLECVLTPTPHTGTKDESFKITFGTNHRIVTCLANDFSPQNVSYEIPLNAGYNNVTCNATSLNSSTVLTWIIEVEVYYIPPTTIATTTTEPPTTLPMESTTPTSNVQVPQTTDSNSQSREGDDPIILVGWEKWVLGGGALLITICVVVGCIVMHRQRKPQPADSTYANLTKDQNKSTPVPAPRTIEKNVPQKPNAARKPNVALENNYSEPKDSQDMSEALYADPNRFVGDSSNYAEPYVAKPSPHSDMYAEPYKSNYAEPYSSTSEGNYAELNLPDCSRKELYAKPIPKAQRKPKVKDDCNYSNVFGAQYGNTKK